MNEEMPKKEIEIFLFYTKTMHASFEGVKFQFSRKIVIECGLLKLVKSQDFTYLNRKHLQDRILTFRTAQNLHVLAASLLTNETKKEFSFTKTIVVVHETLKNSLSCFHRPET